MAVDPGALYNENLANLQFNEHQQDIPVEQEYGTYNPITGTWSGGQADARSGAKETALTQQETLPGNPYQVESNRANRGGILTSGTNTARKTTIASGFAARRLLNTTGLAEGRAKGLTQLQGFKATREHGEVNAGKQRTREQDEYNAANPTMPVAAAAPGQPRTPIAPARVGQPRVRTIKVQRTTRG